MAKVLEQGTKHLEIRKAKHRCDVCASLIEFDKSDVQGDQREGDYVDCPVCTAYISSNRLRWGD